MVLAYLMVARQARVAQSRRQQPYGLYTERDVMEKAMPIVQAMMPNRNDLYMVADHEATPVQPEERRAWELDCVDGKGSGQLHMTFNADTGAMGVIRYNREVNPNAPHSAVLSAQAAVAEACRWLRILDDQKNVWTVEGAPRYTHNKQPLYDEWLVTLLRPGWRARISLRARTGMLICGSILPAP
jgi:hypothetical protein